MAITNTGAVADAYSAYAKTAGTSGAEKTEKTPKTEATEKFKYGNTVGNPKLSEEGAKYYEELKKKFSNMDFVLVSNDEKENAEAKAARFANPAKLLVLIDEEKIEKMVSDENFRKKYETIISNAAAGIDDLKSQLEKSGANVAGFGARINDDGTTSYFAVLKKSSDAQAARIEKKAEEKKVARKAAEKKASKEAAEKRLEKSRAERAEKADSVEKSAEEKYARVDKSSKEDELVTFTAGSVEELMKKIGDYTITEMSNNVMTQAEKMVGQNFDFRG